MAKGPRYNLPYRRRRKQLTNYKKRKAYVLSGKVRMVVRTSNKHTTVQFIEARPQGDVVLTGAKSSELMKQWKWNLGTGNMPASYLTGLLAGKRALGTGLQSAILDIGLRRASKGSKIFAALKGALDAGVDIPHGVEILPQESRIRGEHISTYGVALASQKERVGFQFSRYLDKKGGPEIILSEFDKIKQRIIGEEKESLKVEKK